MREVVSRVVLTRLASSVIEGATRMVRLLPAFSEGSDMRSSSA